jgi:hypothetical protein
MATRKKITLNLKKDLILEAVKTDTYLTGQAEKTVDGANNARSFTEQAGNDKYHERKLMRTLYGAVGRFEVELADFVDSSVGTVVVDNVPIYSIDNTLSDADNDFTIYFFTSSRFNEGLIKPMCQLAQEYLINKMIAMWWMAIKPDLANTYQVYANDSLASIRKCLTKTSPTTPTTTDGGETTDVPFDSVTGISTDIA